MSGTSSPGCGGPSLAVSHHCVFGWFFLGFFLAPSQLALVCASANPVSNSSPSKWIKRELDKEEHSAKVS